MQHAMHLLIDLFLCRISRRKSRRDARSSSPTKDSESLSQVRVIQANKLMPPADSCCACYVFV